jgi:ectoine hydroxylase-related dioxygenase (phytanoyl-CoA dioxygenase family)
MTPQQRLSWDTFGYVVVENALLPSVLQRAQQAFDNELERVAAAPATPAKRPGDKRVWIQNLLDLDEVFVELVDHPALLPVLEGAIGDDLVLTLVQAFAYPPSDRSFTPWHSDLGHFVGIDLTRQAYFARVMIYLSDVGEDGGCFAYVPGSHRLDVATIVSPPVFEDPEMMPQHVKFPGPAGTAIVFNAYGWHTALPNKSEATRKCLQYGYCHAWVQFLNTAKAPHDVERLATTGLRRQLFGLQRPWETPRRD